MDKLKKEQFKTRYTVKIENNMMTNNQEVGQKKDDNDINDANLIENKLRTQKIGLVQAAKKVIPKREKNQG